MHNDVVKVNDYFVRHDVNIGLFFYRTNTGLVYAIANHALNRNLENLSKAQFVNNIAVIINSYMPTDIQLLPDPKDWPGGPQEKLRKPLVVNWLITNNCTHRCYYCYANDVIDNDRFACSEKTYKEIAYNIIKQNPLAVVLSGGEPLLCQGIEKIIGCLMGKAGIIIDTNGYRTDEMQALVPLLKENKIHVRVSLDTLRIKEISKTRPSRVKINDEKNLSQTMSTVNLLLQNDIDLTIQTVLTKRNANDLLAMGDKLWRMGVKTWRIFELQESFKPNENTDLLVFSDIRDKKIRRNSYFYEILQDKCLKYWHGMVIKQTPAEGDRNNVVLVLPDGKFYTQAKNNAGKVLLNGKNPYMASSYTYAELSWGAHFERYIQSSVSKEIKE